MKDGDSLNREKRPSVHETMPLVNTCIVHMLQPPPKMMTMRPRYCIAIGNRLLETRETLTIPLVMFHRSFYLIVIGNGLRPVGGGPGLGLLGRPGTAYGAHPRRADSCGLS